MDWIEEIPKIELHLHLEGAIPLPALWELIQKYGGDPDVPDEASLAKKFEYSNFLQFIDAWIWKNRFLREYEDFTWIAEAVGHDLASQNVRYAECFFSPIGFFMHGLKTQGLAEAIRQGFDRVPEVEINLISDLERDSSLVQVERTLAEVKEVRSSGVIGIGIGGPEKGYPPDRFAQVYDDARQSGLHTTAHAGEAAGAESIWGAIRSLKVERIGHGTRAEEDPSLIDYLVQHQIPLEMCPISNLRTRVVSSPEELPMRRYFDRGILVTISSDDPKMFGNSLVDEYHLLIEKLGFTAEQVRTLLLYSVHAAWATSKQKERLEHEILAFQI
jgi:adenosine deaminase